MMTSFAIKKVKKCWETHDQFNDFWTVISFVLMVLSLGAGMVKKLTPLYWQKLFHCLPLWFSVHENSICVLVVGFWLALPPFYLWVDWVVYREEITGNHDLEPKGINENEMKSTENYVKHTHDLARNLWLALFAVLSYLFDVSFIKFPR